MTQLDAILADLPGLAIAVSGGVDSMTLAHAAHRARVPRLRVIHALSPAVPEEATARRCQARSSELKCNRKHSVTVSAGASIVTDFS